MVKLFVPELEMVTLDLVAKGIRHVTKIRLPGMILFYSYSDLFAFRSDWEPDMVVCEAKWTKTTTEHINKVTGTSKKDRLPREEFEQRVLESLKKLVVSGCEKEETQNEEIFTDNVVTDFDDTNGGICQTS